MTRAEVIELIRVKYPKHTKQAYSLAMRTEETGVMLCPGAKEIDDIAHERKQYKENRKNPFRIYGRLPEALAEKVKAKLAAQNTTMQEVLLFLLTQWAEA